ncbi:MAG: glycosyltransferase family 1 protein [Planctomycetota bacterium]|nr:MAG: glycosyltransferase family 1 protein [Planctomycetota bacterium]
MENFLRSLTSGRPRIMMISTHGYVAGNPPLGAADTGGQVVYVLELSKKFADLGYEVDIWTRQFEDQPPFDDMDEHVRVIRVPCGGKDFIPKEYLYKKLPEWGEHAHRFIVKHKLNYQFINSHYWDAGLAGQHLSEVLGVPHVHTPHSLGLWKQQQMREDFPGEEAAFEKQYNFERRIHHERNLYRECDLVISTTPVQTDMFVSDYDLPAKKVKMIPPGYDDNRFFAVSDASRQAARSRFGFSGKVILALGRLAENKGYDLLVDAFPLIAQRDPEAVLHLAVGGDNMGEAEQRIYDELQEKVAELGIKDRVIFGGYVSDEDLPDVYRAADCFVLCSRYEPFGMTAIEAMASGTPTIITCHGGLWRATTYGRHALIADPFDREDLGITITKVLKLPLMARRLSTMGAHRARSLFTWTGIAQQVLRAVEARSTKPFSVLDDAWDEPWNEGD